MATGRPSPQRPIDIAKSEVHSLVMSKRAVPFFALGTVDRDGRVFIYMGLGVFKSARAAAERCLERKAVVFENAELWSNGVNYGHAGYKPVAQCVGHGSRS
jgi:hypothetical protein